MSPLEDGVLPIATAGAALHLGVHSGVPALPDAADRAVQAAAQGPARDCEVPILPCYIHGSNQAKSCLLRREKLSVSYGTVIDTGWIQSCPSGRDGWERITEEAMRRISLLKSRFADSQMNSKKSELKESSSERGAI